MQKLIHQLKYKGPKENGAYLAKRKGKELAESSEFNANYRSDPRKKLSSQGFDHAEYFGKEIAATPQAPHQDQVQF